MISLIDGDLIAYRCAASCEKQGVVTEDLGIAQARANELLRRIVAANSGELDFIVYLSGGENFRKKINPAYKANRENTPRPAYLEPLREFLVVNWGAEVTDGIEADDALGITQTAYTLEGTESVICTLDKDLRQVPGKHYSWEISGTSSTGKLWTRPEETLVISPREGLFNFYWQLVMGDASDNIFGFDGIARTKIPQKLYGLHEEMSAMETEQELFSYVRELYDDDGRFLMNGACLYIQREENENWLDHGQLLMKNSND
jgi:5'-3' exonuclease